MGIAYVWKNNFSGLQWLILFDMLNKKACRIHHWGYFSNHVTCFYSFLGDVLMFIQADSLEALFLFNFPDLAPVGNCLGLIV